MSRAEKYVFAAAGPARLRARIRRAATGSRYLTDHCYSMNWTEAAILLALILVNGFFQARPGTTVQLTVWRDGKRLQVLARLRSGENDN